ncbi:hypothetical protein BH24GEM3_BH24GEM3_11250 [soil metagenome]|jgi:CO/xanthine dehydrogenase FAD-binding subunit
MAKVEIRSFVKNIMARMRAETDYRLRNDSRFRRQTLCSTLAVAADGLGIGPFRVDASAANLAHAEIAEEDARAVNAAESVTYSYHPRWFESAWISPADLAEEI